MEVVSNKSKGSFNSLVPSNWLVTFLESRKMNFPDGKALFAYQVDQQESVLSCSRSNALLKLAKEL